MEEQQMNLLTGLFKDQDGGENTYKSPAVLSSSCYEKCVFMSLEDCEEYFGKDET